MKVVQASSSGLILEEPPAGRGAQAGNMLGVIGCGAPLVLVGVLLLYSTLKSDHVDSTMLLGSLVPLVAGGAFLAFFQSSSESGQASRRITIAGGRVLEEVLDGSGELKSEEFAVRGQVGGCFCPASKDSERLRGIGSYKVYLHQHQGTAYQLDTPVCGKDFLLLLLRLRNVLELPVSIEGLLFGLRPGPDEGSRAPKSQCFRLEESENAFEVDFSAAEREEDANLGYFVFGLALFGLFLIGKGYWDDNGVEKFMGMGMLAFDAWLGWMAFTSEPSFVRLRLANGALTLTARNRTCEQPLEALRDIVILNRGLYFVFDDEVYDVLTGRHDRDELCYLYHAIARALEAQGWPVPSGLMEERPGPA